MVVVCTDPKQKKLSFFLSSQKKGSGTIGTTNTQKQLEHHERLAVDGGKNFAWAGVSAEKNVEDQSHAQSSLREQAILTNTSSGISTENNVEGHSHGENALHEQDILTNTSRKDLEDVQNCFHGDVFGILAMHGHDPRLMDQDGFKQLVSWFNPMVKMPSHSDVESDFWKLYRQEESKVKERLAALRSQVCLSAYIWNYDPNSTFLCLNVHYIDDGWVKRQKVIRFSRLNPSCRSEKLGGELTAIISGDIEKLGLHGKVFCIILDDSFSDDSVISNVNARFQEHNKVTANRSLFVICYTTHLLDRVIQVLLDELERIMEGSSKHSDYKILGPIASVVQYPNFRYATSNEAWRKAQNICGIMKGFHEHMDFMNDSPSSADVFDKLWDVKKEVHVKADIYTQSYCSFREEEALSHVQWEMQKVFNERWKVYFFHLCMPMVMDPKYRLERIKSRIQRFTVATHYSLDEDIDHYKIHYVHDTFLTLFNEYSRKVEDPNCSSGSGVTKKKFGYRDELVEYYLHIDCPYGERPLSELDQYIQEPGLTTGDTSVFQWWKEHNLTYPTISRMARDILALLSSTDCKVATRTARKAMAESGLYFVEELVCIQDWLKPDGTAIVESTNG